MTFPTALEMVTPPEKADLAIEMYRENRLLRDPLATPSHVDLPADVFVSPSETLPRELVTACAKNRCRRCGTQGWFWLRDNAVACPCTQKKVAQAVATARAMLAEQQKAEAEQ